MTIKDSISYRTQDILHRILTKVSGSQSTIAPVFGDSVYVPDVYYVYHTGDNTSPRNGSDTNDGRDPAFPLATIDAAINKCTASQGDVVIVQPGHIETLTTQISLDVIGVSIIGIGEGTLRPTITVNGGIDGIGIGAANCRVENILFNEATDAAADSAINVDAANAVIEKCHFDLGVNDDEGTITVTSSGDLLTVKNCTVIVTANGPEEWILFEGAVDRPIIEGNVVVASDGADAFDDGIINGGSVVVTNAVVKGNTFLGAGVAVTTLPNIGSWTGQAIGPNGYADGANPADDINDERWYRVTNEVTFAVADTGDFSANSGEHEVFTVTGTVHVKLTCICTTGPGNSAGDIAFGTGDVSPLTIIATTPEQDLDTNELWYDATPDGLAAAPSVAQFERIINGTDIGYAITTADVADGAMLFICEWRPISEDGNVVAATIGAAATI